MNRRNAVKKLLVFGLLTSAGYSGYKIYSIKKKPDIGVIERYRLLISDIAETIIPTTDSPGAKSCNVQDFIINIIRNCTTIEDQNNFLNGLQDVADYCQDNFKCAFSCCTPKQKLSVLAYFENKEVYGNRFIKKVNRRILGQPFIVQFKMLTVQGYCMSKSGATKGLSYDYIPGEFNPCLTLKEHQKSWATK